METERTRAKLILTALFHGFLGYSSFQYLTVLNSMEPWMKDFLNSSISAHYGHTLSLSQLNWAWSIIAGSFAVGCMIGSATMKYPLDYFGRRDTVMLVRNIVVLVSALLQGISKPTNCAELLLVGRVLSGVGMIQSFQTSMFMAECSPTACRGLASCLPSFGMRLWLLLGATFSLEFCGANEDTWHLILMYPIIPSFLHLLTTAFFPKSPKFLFINEGNEKEARKSVEFYHGPKTDFGKLAQEYSNEADASNNLKSVGFREILSKRQLRWPLALVTVALLMFPFSGCDIAFLYSTGIMQSVGISPEKAPLYNLFLIQVPGALFNIFCTLIIDRVGRRPILIGSSLVSTVGVFGLSFVTPATSVSTVFANVLSVSALAMIFMGHSGGITIVATLLAGEVAPQAGRAFMSGFGNFLFSFLVIVIAFGYPPASAAIGSYAALPIALGAALSTLFLFCFLPETKGKSVDEIVGKWMYNVN